MFAPVAKKVSPLMEEFVNAPNSCPEIIVLLIVEKALQKHPLPLNNVSLA
jgi:hypothetical protein